MNCFVCYIPRCISDYSCCFELETLEYFDVRVARCNTKLNSVGPDGFQDDFLE